MVLAEEKEEEKFLYILEWEQMVAEEFKIRLEREQMVAEEFNENRAS